MTLAYSTRMYCYEQFNSWLSERELNQFWPEATIMETYRVRTFCSLCVHNYKIKSTQIFE